ncbi:MAG: protoglobin family protein [Myxococcales bacterium]|nr:protoglobin family protein [Myxococcales bacterium]
MKHIDEARLEQDVQYRFEYLCEFMGFGEDDVATITGAAALLAPLVTGLVDAVYTKLFTYDCTRRPFAIRQHGYTGEIPGSLEQLTQDHPMIQFRKSHLAKYLERLVTGPYDARMVRYLDVVGEIHTASKGNPEIVVPLVQMNALMGFVADAINATILSLGLPAEAQAKAIRSFAKLLWIQNDLIGRHYQAKPATAD